MITALQSAAREAAVMAEVGPGGLLASDFQLSQRLARLSVQQARCAPRLAAGVWQAVLLFGAS